MHRNTKITQLLKYGTLATGLLLASVVYTGLQNEETTSNLSARLVPQNERKGGGEVPIIHVTSERSVGGFTAPADSHVIFQIPLGVRISRNIFFGPEYDLERYWGYCFDGRENARKAQGKRGLEIYNEERFFYSLAERRAQSYRPKPTNDDLLGILDTLHGAAPDEPDSYYNVFKGGETCYVMSSVQLPLGIDQDGDLLNNALERARKTDPNNPDTDGDGIKDGDEIYTTKTNPTLSDTDLDGLSDLCEDKDQDGLLEAGETSPLTWDTDKDELCDGTGQGCKGVSFETLCEYVNGDRECNVYPSHPVWTELGQNLSLISCPTADDYFTDPTNPLTYGMPDWDYQWEAFVGGTPGNPAPELPIPELP